MSALLISQPSAPRFSATSGGVRKPTSAVPITGLLSVQRSASCGRVLRYFRREWLQFLDRGEVAQEVLRAEQGSEQVQAAEHAALRAPIALRELHATVKGAA
jgi:hypothetical protein